MREFERKRVCRRCERIFLAYSRYAQICSKCTIGRGRSIEILEGH